MKGSFIQCTGKDKWPLGREAIVEKRGGCMNDGAGYQKVSKLQLRLALIAAKLFYLF